MYPEHKKLDRGGEFEAIKNFCEFVSEQGYLITDINPPYKHGIDVQKVLYHYFNVDEKRIELERREMLR